MGSPKTNRLAGEIVGALVARRQELGLAQVDVAARIGRSQSSVADFEKLKYDPRMGTILRYARAVEAQINISVEEHFDDEDDEL